MEELYQLLSDLGVNSWQLQIALPMGNFAKRPEWLIEPQDILSIIEVITDVEILFFLNSFNALILLLNDPDLRIKS